MAKQKWKPGNMVYPLPAVLVSCGDKKGNINVMTAAWTGTICSDPPMLKLLEILLLDSLLFTFLAFLCQLFTAAFQFFIGDLPTNQPLLS